jgi:hypothetical protein
MDIERVRLLISGGFAGLVRGAETSGVDLALDERRALERHTHGQASTASGDTRDLLNYELEIHAAGEVRRLHFDELNTPADLAGLVQRLTARSRPVRP